METAWRSRLGTALALISSLPSLYSSSYWNWDASEHKHWPPALVSSPMSDFTQNSEVDSAMMHRIQLSASHSDQNQASRMGHQLGQAVQTV